jgi:RluA family pseudouridine synthase
MEKDYTFKTSGKHEFRCVVPYDHNYLTHCKERWRGQPLLSIFLSEFKAYNESYYTSAIQSGRIQINLKKVDLSYILKNGDSITHKAHRNEPPVLSTPIRVVFNSKNFLVVYKPASMPVHPSGAYHKNSMIYILEHEMNFPPLHLIHRLDRVTSGIILLAKNGKTAAEATKMFQSDSMQKFYVARVRGRLCEVEFEVDVGISCIDHKNGVYQADPKGKESKTKFKVLFYDARNDMSVVRCQPLTGRTHQIRVHLKFIGHPIANDVAYGGDFSDPVIPPEVNFRLHDGNEGIELDQTKQVEIWLCSFRYVLSQNLDFSIPLPDWALPSFSLTS